MHQVGDQPRLYYDARSTNHQDWSLFQGNCVLGNVLWVVFSALCSREEVKLRWISRGIREVFSENKRVLCIHDSNCSYTYYQHTLTRAGIWENSIYFEPSVYRYYTNSTKYTVGSSSSILKWNVIMCLLVWMEFKCSQTDQEFQLRFLLINHWSFWNPIQYHDRDILSLDLWTKWDKFLYLKADESNFEKVR